MTGSSITVSGFSTSMPARVAVVHDYFTQRGGAERVAAHMARVFEAPVFTSVFDHSALPPTLTPSGVRATFLQPVRELGVPLTPMAPLLPSAFARLDLRGFDVIISSTSAFAHHVRRRNGSVHVSYCHTPPHFLWERGEYFRGREMRERLLRPALERLRRQDVAAARRVDRYLANSEYTAARIQDAYGIPARVVYPPVDTSALMPSSERSGRFLVVSRLRRHKRIDVAIAAATLLAEPLDIIGDGPDLPRLRKLAGPTVRFLGPRSDDEVRHAMARCIALVVPATGDFGLTLVEAQASGRPPIAHAAGGALEIIRDGETGFLFDGPSVPSLAAAMVRARTSALDPAALLASAGRFDAATFDRALVDAIEEAVAERHPRRLARLEPRWA
jgi:glycosyltransferase involved in cell wall biosynthesis